MRLLHTADWHIGQLFYEYDRSFEHEQFLNWLLNTLQDARIDVLLISGDVFDLSNPSAASVRLFYSFLNRAIVQQPGLQIVITAGNHDSAARLETPKPLLFSTNIHIVGLIGKDEKGAPDYSKLVIPLFNQNGDPEVMCIAVPFLRQGDYPQLNDCSNPYAEGVTAFFEEAYRYAAGLKQEGQAIIAMGHLHAQQASVSDIDQMERLIMGGVESVAASAFHEDIAYVALGHIHKAQRIGGKEHIRYSGSPLPMSFSETNYKHQVIVFELSEGKLSGLEALEIPLSVPLLRVPARNSVPADVLHALHQLPVYQGTRQTAPYLEVRVLLKGPEPGLRHSIETAIEGKNYRLAKIDVCYESDGDKQKRPVALDDAALRELKPVDILQSVYEQKYNVPVPEGLLNLFRQVEAEVGETENLL
jgi:exonuclease SbcD